MTWYDKDGELIQSKFGTRHFGPDQGDQLYSSCEVRGGGGDELVRGYVTYPSSYSSQ